MKNDNIANIFKIFMCCTGTIIGAGFASGQEIMSFFVRYGKWGAVGMTVSGVLFVAYIYAVLKKIYVCSVDSFSGYFENISGKTVSDAIQLVSYGFMMASFCVMVSGSGAVAEELFGMKTAGILFMAILCFVVFLNGVSGMVVVNAIMTPVIILGILIMGICTAMYAYVPTFSKGIKLVTDNFFTSALVYVSYNTITLIGVLVPLKERVTSEKVVFFSALLSGVALCIMGMLLIFSMTVFENEISSAQVPMLYISSKAGAFSEYAYGVVLYMAMITTAVSSGFAFISFVRRYFSIRKEIISFALCLVSVPLAYVGFADLVSKLYGFFGFLGLYILFLVLLDGIRIKKLKKAIDKGKKMY